MQPNEQATIRANRPRRYDWVEKVIERGLPDGRKRFILYVLSAYLVDVKHLSEEEALEVIRGFIENSCMNYNKCDKIYDSFIRGDLARVRSKGIKPVSLEKLKERDPELYELIAQVASLKTQ